MYIITYGRVRACAQEVPVELVLASPLETSYTTLTRGSPSQYTHTADSCTRDSDARQSVTVPHTPPIHVSVTLTRGSPSQYTRTADSCTRC